MHGLAKCQNILKGGNRLDSDPFRSKHLEYLILLPSMVTLVLGRVLFLLDPQHRAAREKQLLSITAKDKSNEK